MTEWPTPSLAEQLKGPLPPSIAGLDDAAKADLADALRDARRRQTAALAKAGEDGLSYVPALLRGTVRKVIGL